MCLFFTDVVEDEVVWPRCGGSRPVYGQWERFQVSNCGNVTLLKCWYVLSNIKSILVFIVITFRVSRRRREMYCGHARLCVRVCVSAVACLHYCTDPDVTWGSGRGCPLVVLCWADLQLVHGLRCYGDTRNAWQPSGNPPGPLHVLRMPAQSPLASDKINAPATRPFHFIHTAGVL